MPYMNDMSTLAQVVSPAFAAQQAGMQSDLANQQQMLENQKAQEQMPFIAPKAQADIANTQATTGLTNAQAGGVGLKNLFTQQTMPGDVKATNAGNAAKAMESQLQQVGQLGQLAGVVAQQMDGVPPAARPAAMRQLLQSRGVDVNSLQGTPLEGLMNGDPDQLRQFSQQAIQASSQFQTQSALEGQKAQSAENVANISGQYHVQGAQASADARRYAADQQRLTKQLQQSTDQAIAALVQRIGTPNEQPDDKARLKFLQQQQVLVRQMNAQTTQQLVGVGGQNPTLDIGGGQPSGGGGQPAPAGGPALQQALKAQGIDYEPDKFDYRVGPNGNIQRKPK